MYLWPEPAQFMRNSHLGQSLNPPYVAAGRGQLRVSHVK